MSGYYRMGANARIRDGINPGNGKPLSAVTLAESLLDRPLSPAEREDLLHGQSPLSPQQMGYTGNLCTNCGGTRMLIAGHCEVCADCGESSGCS